MTLSVKRYWVFKKAHLLKSEAIFMRISALRARVHVLD